MCIQKYNYIFRVVFHMTTALLQELQYDQSLITVQLQSDYSAISVHEVETKPLIKARATYRKMPNSNDDEEYVGKDLWILSPNILSKTLL